MSTGMDKVIGKECSETRHGDRGSGQTKHSRGFQTDEC